MLPESLRSSPRVFHGARFDVHAVELPGGGGGSQRREVVVHQGAVVILPLVEDPSGRPGVAMIRNERFAVGRTLWELPAGTLEPGEDPAVCAARELIEETGYEAKRITKMLEFFTTPGFCTERMWAFVAEDLRHVGQALEETERITVEVIGLDKTMQMIGSGEVCDAKTIATLLYYQTFQRA
jgi:ADP-ribose pyrophosphatase